MKLRSQMLVAAALTLAVPLVGWQSVKQLYSSLQQTRIDEQSLKVANMRLALSEVSEINSALEKGMETGQGGDWFAEVSPYPMFTDGYEDDWQTLVSQPLLLANNGQGPAASLRIAEYGSRLNLFISVADETLEYHVPPVLQPDAPEGVMPDLQARLVNGDSVELLLQTDDANQSAPVWQHALFRAIAPGTIEALYASDSVGRNGRRYQAGTPIDDWQGVWIQTQDGYQLEVSLPLPLSGSKVAIAVLDVDSPGGDRRRWSGNLSPRQMRSIQRSQVDPSGVQCSLLFRESAPANQRLKGWTTAGSRSRLYDAQGRLLADVNRLYDRNTPEDVFDEAAYSRDGIWDAILLRVFAFFVAGDLPLMDKYSGKPESLHLQASRLATVVGGQAVTSRYVSDENDRVLGTLAGIGSEPSRGFVLYESNEEHSSAYAGSELARLFSLLLLVSLLAGSGLLMFALVLSSRISRLSHEAQYAVTNDGRVKGLPGSDATDEIGDLSRKLSTLLARSAAYTHYLEALSSRLSHELRTPLSVVRTSIENIDRESLDEQSLMLLDRASDGADHLGSIIKALVESTRLEQTVQLAQIQPIELGEWLAGSMARYQQVYPDLSFTSEPGRSAGRWLMASPELLSQAFDKLVDNAASFSRTGQIILSLHIERKVLERATSIDTVAMTVSNEGPPLDENRLSQLFEAMYSDRQSNTNQRPQDLHLGLGLYIVKMIAEAHDGEVLALNDEGWVRMGMRLPVT